jgi:hypothetical protein
LEEAMTKEFEEMKKRVGIDIDSSDDASLEAREEAFR